MPQNKDEMLNQLLPSEAFHQIVSPNLHRILPNIRQKFIRLNKSDRQMELLKLVKEDVRKRRPVIVFANQAKGSDFAAMFLNDQGIPAVNLNGDMLSKIRVGQFEKFQTGLVNVLATTDIVSRGLDTTRVGSLQRVSVPPATNSISIAGMPCDQLRLPIVHGRLHPSRGACGTLWQRF